ncbi:MAG: hypothetical protein VX589_06370 [Myxococcota bacterium]|nr:hypothetical protein [Myxococcota bacterium]
MSARTAQTAGLDTNVDLLCQGRLLAQIKKTMKKRLFGPLG